LKGIGFAVCEGCANTGGIVKSTIAAAMMRFFRSGSPFVIVLSSLIGSRLPQLPPASGVSVVRHVGPKGPSGGFETDQLAVMAELRHGVGIVIVEEIGAFGQRGAKACTLELTDGGKPLLIAIDHIAQVMEPCGRIGLGNPISVDRFPFGSGLDEFDHYLLHVGEAEYPGRGTFGQNINLPFRDTEFAAHLLDRWVEIAHDVAQLESSLDSPCEFPMSLIVR